MTTKINENQKVTVFGAYGYTGKFIVTELVKCGWTPILSGRNKDKLEALGTMFPSLEIRPAAIDNANALDVALEGAVAVINCAGPFVDTAIPLLHAALRKQIHYLDVTAEQQSVLTTYQQFSAQVNDKGIIILPAMAFYGGLADLLATAAMGDWATASTIDIAIALDSWMPTLGTRLTGQRNTGRRLIFSNNTLQFIADPLPTRQWNFSSPFGLLDVKGFPLSEIITLSKHLQVDEINTYINLAPIQDIHNSETPPPKASDASGRSSQTFLMEVEIRSAKKLRRAMAAGRDIYAITAPLVVEATRRIVKGMIKKTGVVAAGEVFDTKDFLHALSPEYLSIEIINNE